MPAPHRRTRSRAAGLGSSGGRGSSGRGGDAKAVVVAEEEEAKVEACRRGGGHRDKPSYKKRKRSTAGEDGVVVVGSAAGANGVLKGNPSRDGKRVASSKRAKRTGKHGDKVLGSKVLGGKVLSVSCEGDQDDLQGAAEPGYGAVKKLVENLGGQVSSTVHKRVFALVATERACRRRTQRVRKALKVGVPIVAIGYLHACEQARQVLALDQNFALQVPDAPAPSSSAKDIADADASVEAAGAQGYAREVDLGCCCSCHDSGKASCDWCESHHV